MPRPFVVLLVAALLSCRGTESAPVAAAGLRTVFDSTGDTVLARVDGDVSAGAIRTLVEVSRIAPSVDDTSLFGEVADLEVDAARRTWVYDFQGRRLFLFDSTGALVRRIGREGSGPGEFAQGNGLVELADTGLAILDSRNARVSFFTSAGDFRTSWPVPVGFSTSNGLVGDRSQALYLRRPVTPPREGEILGRMGLVRLLEGGAFGDSLAPPDLPVQRDTYLAVSPDGRGRSSTSSSFAPNYYWDWHPDGFFVAAHGGRYEIVISRPGARPVLIRRAPSPVPIAPDEREQEKERIIWSMRQTQPGWTWTGPEIPTHKAPLAGLTVARDGTIWARVAMPSERIPDAELPPRRENSPPPRMYRSPAEYEVFAADGRFLGRVAMPPRTTVTTADGEFVWAITRDADDLPAVVRYRLSIPFSPE